MDELRQTYRNEEDELLRTQPHKPLKVPNFNKKPAAVKLNTAAIVREEAQLVRQEIEAERVMKEFEYNLRDDSEYNRWVSEMNQKEAIETEEH